VTNPTQAPEHRRACHESPNSDETNHRPLRVNPFRVFRAFVASTPVSGLDAEATDTSYESGDTLLCTRQQLGDSVRWLNAYRVPFSVGATWPCGLAGTYIQDITGDSIPDTLSIWGDTCGVADTEDVTVPFGAVAHCYKLRRVMRQRLAAQQFGVPVVESSYIRTFGWYKDSLWLVKESTQASGPIYTFLVLWLHAADFVSTDVAQLNGLGYMGAAEQPRKVNRGTLTVCPNPFRSSVAIRWGAGPLARPAPLRIFDAQGRLVRLLPAPSPAPCPPPLSWDGRDHDGHSLPPGTYFARADTETHPIVRLR